MSVCVCVGVDVCVGVRVCLLPLLTSVLTWLTNILAETTPKCYNYYTEDPEKKAQLPPQINRPSSRFLDAHTLPLEKQTIMAVLGISPAEAVQTAVHARVLIVQAGLCLHFALVQRIHYEILGGGGHSTKTVAFEVFVQ